MRSPPPWALGLYNTMGTVVTPFLLPLLAFHPRLAGGLGQRLGRWRVRPTARAPVWLHGSSAGDVSALVPLGHELSAAGHPLVVSAWTRTGHEMALKRCGGEGQVYRAPLDLPGPVGRVLTSLRPSLVVLECLEIWPNLVSGCQRRGIRVAVVNGRLSPASARRYKRARWLFGPCFTSLAMVSALTDADAARFVELGVPADRVTVETSSKHGAPPRHPAAADKPRLVLGSIHRDEERVLLPWIARLRRRVPGLEVEVAPRHPHRARSIHRRLVRDGVPCSLRSQASGPVVVHDGVGELASAYGGATVAFVGGSLNGRGGHNIVEPASQGVPVLTGPDTEHCRREVELLRQVGACLRVNSGEEFFSKALTLLSEPEQARRRGEGAYRVALHLAGAAARISRQLLDLLPNHGVG